MTQPVPGATPTPVGPPEDSIRPAWLDFTKATRTLLVVQLDDRPLDQFLVFRDDVMRIVEGEEFLEQLEQAWSNANAPQEAIRKLLLMELKSFAVASEVAAATAKAEATKEEGKVSRWLGRAGTVTGSVNDLLTNLPPFAKNALTVFRELVDLFKGKD